mmetsp:Transcript_43209/g.46903  ORF Transcript_43209/g.46903 Transcript_43209/m.46903 type:complete len:179 (-) Transcript_43209:904-1440(-)
MTSNKMNLLFFALMSTLPIKDSFAFVQQKMKHKKWITRSFANKNSNNELEIDVDKAVYCASHFGECPVEEIEKLRDGLHAHQVQNMVFGDCTNDGFEETYFEGELTLQLDLLKKDMSNPYLLPSEEFGVVPSLRDNTAQVVDGSRNMEVFKELVEDGALESLAMCGMIGLLMMAPQLI